MDSAWERLLDLVGRLAADPALAVGPESELAISTLCSEAVEVGDIDSELHVPDVARWLVGLVHAHRTVRETHPDVEADRDLGVMLLIITRWLHRARPR